MATNQMVQQGTPSQRASAACHLERRAEWHTVRVNGTRYVVMPSGNSDRTYWVRADADGCSCIWYARTLTSCSHMLAVRQANAQDAASQPARPVPTHGARCLTDMDAQAALDAIQARIRAGQDEKPRRSYADIFPKCWVDGCTDLSDTSDGLCWLHASDREHAARMAAKTEVVARGTASVDSGEVQNALAR